MADVGPGDAGGAGVVLEVDDAALVGAGALGEEVFPFVEGGEGGWAGRVGVEFAFDPGALVGGVGGALGEGVGAGPVGGGVGGGVEQ